MKIHTGRMEKLRYEGLAIHLKDDYARKEQKMKHEYENAAQQAQRDIQQKEQLEKMRYRLH
jgi:hypothetical protein